jgi:formylglycine-generating enzyme required for sulfatase activity
MKRAFLGGLVLFIGVSLAAIEFRAAPSLKTALPTGYTETIRVRVPGAVNPLEFKFDMVAVREGSFRMGSPAGEAGRRPNEGPQLPVKVNAFWIGKHEVTWDEFELFYKTTNPDSALGSGDVKGTPEGEPKADAVTRPTAPYVDESYGHEVKRHPALCMTHHCAMKYCEWLSAKTGRHYRLPSEAEWEYACRAGTTGAHHCDPAELKDFAWFADNSTTNLMKLGTTHPVGSKKPNAWGIHDMHGNVMEWCLDHYLDNAYEIFAKQHSGKSDLLRPLIAPVDCKWRHVARGGHFQSSTFDLRSAARVGSEKAWMKHDPQVPQSIWWLTKLDTIGFRVCRSVGPDDLDGITSKLEPTNDRTYEP